MHIQSFQAKIDDRQEVVSNQLHEGLNVIDAGPWSSSISSQIANRLYGETAESPGQATVSFAKGADSPSHLETNSPAALASARIEVGDLRLLRETLFLQQGGEDLPLCDKAPGEVCICGRANCPGGLITEPGTPTRSDRSECRQRLELARQHLQDELRLARETHLQWQQKWQAHDQRLLDSIAEARQRQTHLRDSICRMEAEIESLAGKITSWETERAAIAWQRKEWNFTSGIAKLETQLAEYEGNLTAMGSLDLPRVDAPVVTDRCKYLERTSAYLAELTGGYLRQVVATGEADSVAAIDYQGRRFGWRALAKSGRNLLRLALSMAAIEGWERHGLHLPLLVEEPFAHLKPNELGHVADTLKRFASGRQVIVFTSREFARQKFSSEIVFVRPVRQPQPAAETRPPEREVHWEHVTTKHVVTNDDDTELESQPPASTRERSLTPKERLVAALRSVGIDSTLEFLDNDPETLAVSLRSHGYSAAELADWQDRIALLHFLPELTDDDVSVLIACQCRDLVALREANPELLHEEILRFLRTAEGSRFRRLRTRYERQRMRQWRQLARRRRDHWNRGAYGLRLSRRHGGETYANQPKNNSFEVSANRESHPETVKLHREDTPATFYLHRSSAIVDAPSIGPKMAERLERIGIVTVADLLAADPESIARRLKHRRTKPEHIEEWQKQARLMCRVPQLRGHDAQILVALDYLEPEQVAATSPTILFADVEPFCETREAKRIIRNMDPPDLAEVSDWINWCRQARALQAA